MTIEPRLRAACLHHRSSNSVVSDLSKKLSEAKRVKLDAEQDIRWCEAFLKFQQRDVVTEYQGLFKLFEIEDGETHMVAATSSDLAMQFYAIELSGYKSSDEYISGVGESFISERPGDTVIPVYDIDGPGGLTVKTAAEWANVKRPCLVSTTAY